MTLNAPAAALCKRWYHAVVRRNRIRNVASTGFAPRSGGRPPHRDWRPLEPLEPRVLLSGDGLGGVAPLNTAEVVERHLFFNNSFFDGGTPGSDPADDGAIAPGKEPLLPGVDSSVDNYTNFLRGINGLFVDISDIPDPTAIDAGDFEFNLGNNDDPSTWTPAPDPSVVEVREGAGDNGSDRVTLIWPDGAITNTWMQVRVLTGDTGLAANDVFYFGNAIGETFNSAGNLFVDGSDLAGVRDNPRNFTDRADTADPFDLNRDSFVDGTDFAIARDNPTDFATDVNHILAPFTAPRLTDVSPADGETMVNVARETIIRFDRPVDPTTVNVDSLQLIANGEQIDGRIVVNSTGEKATFFYDQPLPPSTEVRVIVDGDRILGVDGDPLDADGDGAPGGQRTADFTTLPLVQIPGTELFGFVKDSQTGEPLEGVEISMESFPEVSAVTDATGFFEIGVQDLDGDGQSDGLPAPEFFAHIDGSAVTNQGGKTYASLGKPFPTVPGQREQLQKNGETFDIFLPSIAPDAITPLNADAATDVAFGASDRAMLADMFPDADPAMLDAMRVTIPAGAAVNDQGDPATEAFVVPVDPDFLPAPLPPNLDPALVVSVQTPGATNFDTPAAVSFPNLDVMAPGEQQLLFSFDHDLGQFVVNGTVTVSDDGMSVTSDPGVGIEAPGWHFVEPGTNSDGDQDGPPRPPLPPDCPGRGVGPQAGIDNEERGERMARAANSGVRSGLELLGLASSSSELALGTGTRTSFFGGIGAGADLATAIDEGDAGSWGRLGLSVAGFVPGPVGLAGRLARFGVGVIDLRDNVRDLLEEAENMRNQTQDCGTVLGLSAQSLVETAAEEDDDPIAVLERLEEQLNDLLDQQGPLYAQLDEFGGSLVDLLEAADFESSDLGLTPAEEAQLAGFLRDYDVVVDQLREMPLFLEEVASIALEAQDQLRAVLDEGGPLSDLAGDSLFVALDLGNGTVLRDTPGVSESWSFVLPPNTAVNGTIYNPTTAQLGYFYGVTGESGSELDFGTVALASFDDLPDEDGDGLPDDAEFAVGTNAAVADTDNDGIDDAAEVRGGLDPLGGRSFPTGVIASLPLRGIAEEIVISSSTDGETAQTAYLATGDHGLAIVDITRFNNPIVLGQLDLPGNNIDVAYDEGSDTVVMATTDAGLHFVDVSDPMMPTLRQTIPNESRQLTIHQGVVYAGGDGAITRYLARTGERLEATTIAGTVNDISASPSHLYVLTNTELQVFEQTQAGPALRGSVNVVGFAPPSIGLRRLFVGDSIAYVGHFQGYTTVDISDPAAPAVVGTPPETQAAVHDMKANGSGLLLPVTSFAGLSTLALSLYDGTDPADVTRFQTSIESPGETRAVALASGIAYVADGSAGLQVVNYLSFDSQAQAPTVEIETTAVDRDPDTPGLQVQEGTTIPLTPQVTDDVQVRNVELLIDGVVVRNDVAFPFDLSAAIPALPEGVDAQAVDFQVRAFDTGGNSGVSEALTFDVRPDIFDPTLEATTPRVGEVRGRGLRSVQLAFSEPMDIRSLGETSVFVRAVGGDPVAPFEMQTRLDDQVLEVFYEDPLSPGDYEIVIDGDVVADRAGNPIGGGDMVVSSFSVIDIDAVWIVDPPGQWDDGFNWDSGTVPDPGDTVLIPAGSEAIVGSGTVEAASILVQGTLTLNGGVIDGAEITIADGGSFDIANNFSNRLHGGVVLNGDVTMSRDDLQIKGGLTVNGTLRLEGGSDIFFDNLDEDDASQTLDGNGSIIFDDTVTGTTNRIYAFGGNVALTIGPGLALSGGNVRFGEPWFGSEEMTLINQGVIVADLPGGPIDINGDAIVGVVNEGTLRAESGGSLSINHLDDAAGLSIEGGGALTLDGTWKNTGALTADGSTLILNGQWDNTGAINATDSNVQLGGTFTLADLGTFNRTGGLVQLTGILENTGQTLALNAATGSWQIDGGQIIGGRITTADGAVLEAEDDSTLDSRLRDGVILDGELVLNRSELRFDGGLTVNGVIRFLGGANLYADALGGASVQTIGGSGEMIFGNEVFGPANRLYVYNGQVELTLGPDLTLRGGNVRIGDGRFGDTEMALTNEGTIIADLPGVPFGINGDSLVRFTNNGVTREEDGGILDIADVPE